MTENNIDSVAPAEAFRDLFREIDGAMLAAGAAERDHQVLEAALLIVAYAGIHQRHDAGQKLMHALFLIQIVDDRRVAAGEGFEVLLAAGIGEATAIENESAAMSALIFWQAAME